MRDEQIINCHTNRTGVERVERVFSVDISGTATKTLGFGHDVHGKRRLTRSFWTIDLDNASTRKSANAEGEVEGERTGRNRLHVHVEVLSKSHDRALTELLLDLSERNVERLVLVVNHGGSSLVPGGPTNGNEGVCRELR